METKQGLSGTRTICHRQRNDKQLGSAVPGTLLGIASSATGAIISWTTMRLFVTSSTLLSVPQRKHVIKAQAAATGHEESQATATGQEKKSAATGDTSN